MRPADVRRGRTLGPNMHRENVIARMAQVARALCHQTRLGILAILLNRDATVSELAARLGLESTRISSHLKVLLARGLVSVSVGGRQHVYRVMTERVAPALAALSSLTPTRLGRSSPGDALHGGGKWGKDMRHARTCYDHLAGVADVHLLDYMLRRGWLRPVRRGDHLFYELTTKGARALVQRGVNVIRAHRSRRLFAYGCPDWTEPRPHLGGALGAALLEALTKRGLVQREGRTRRATVARPLASWVHGGAGR